MSKIVAEQVPTREPQEAVSAPATSEELTRQQAIKRIQREIECQAGRR